jgi:predicted ATPase/class 3 adenylate cyclase
VDDHASFGYWVRRRRRALDLTQEALARGVGCSVMMIRRIEADERRPSLQMAARLAEQLGAAEQKALFIQVARGNQRVERLSALLAPPVATRAVGAALPVDLPAQARPALAQPELPGGIVTFLFTDIEGSTTLWQRFPKLMEGALLRHDALWRAAVADAGGVVFKGVGDGICAAFADAAPAAAAAVAGQQAIQAEPWGEMGGLLVRTALHSGSALPRAGDYSGLTVNLAARLAKVGSGGQILLSRPTQELLAGQLPPELTLRELGSHELRDIAAPMQIYQLAAPDLPQEFPPLRAERSRRHNLPAPANALIGRDSELAELRAMLRRDDVRCLTLTGPGGVGKTRLALEAAAGLLDAYPNGVWVAALAPLRAVELLPDALAQLFALPQGGAQSAEQRLLGHLASKRLLLLLDNFEHLVEGGLLVARLLAACPRLTVLITSRVRLRLYGEREYAVQPLGLPAARAGEAAPLDPQQLMAGSSAVRLFVERLQAARGDFRLTADNAATVAAICRRLDGLPLALELAAARGKLFNPAAILARLSGAQRAAMLQLPPGSGRDIPARHHALGATIAWSYDVLPAQEQRLFRRLGVFVGGWTAAAAAAVCAEGPDLGDDLGMLERLESLLDKSLVTLAAPEAGDELRFTMLETIREFALEQLEQSGELEALRARHAAHFLALVETAEPLLRGAEQAAWTARLEAEHDNLRAALAWALAEGAPPDAALLGLRMAGALWWFWLIANHEQEGLGWLERALAADSTVGPERVKALVGAGVLTDLQGDYALSRARCEEGRSLAISISDRRGQSYASLLLGQGLIVPDSDNAAAEHLLKEAQYLAKELGDQWAMAWALYHRGRIEEFRGDAAQARQMYEESLERFRSSGDRVNTSMLLGILGLLAFSQGKLVEARMFLEEDLALCLAAGHRRSIAWNCFYQGVVALEQRDQRHAHALFRESLAIRASLGDKRGIAECLEGLAAVALQQRLPGQAARLCGTAEAIRDTLADHRSPVPQAQYERTVAGITASLGPQLLATFWQQGRSTPLDTVIAEMMRLGDLLQLGAPRT